jgi:hypothetical protein
LVMPRNNQPTCEAYSAGIGFGTDSIKSFQCVRSPITMIKDVTDLI